MKRACWVVALIGLCLAAASAASDKDKPALFEHYLNAGGSSEVPAKMAQYYETKTETACLQATSCCNGCWCTDTCDIVDLPEIGDGGRGGGGYSCCHKCSPLVWMVNFGCTQCHAEHYYGHEKVADVTLDVQGQNSARCIFTDLPSAHPLILEDKPNVIVAGTFTATCYMKDEKDNCGHPDICGAHTTLTVQGVYYAVEKAVLEGTYYEPTFMSCRYDQIIEKIGRRLSESPNNAKAPGDHPEHPENPGHWWEHHGHTQPGTHGNSGHRAVNKKAAREVQASTSPKVGHAIVYMGRVEVSSRHGSSKYDDGYLQYSYFVPDSLDPTTDDVSALPRLRQASLLLQFADKEGREYRY